MRILMLTLVTPDAMDDNEKVKTTAIYLDGESMSPSIMEMLVKDALTAMECPGYVQADVSNN